MGNINYQVRILSHFASLFPDWYSASLHHRMKLNGRTISLSFVTSVGWRWKTTCRLVVIDNPHCTTDKNHLLQHSCVPNSTCCSLLLHRFHECFPSGVTDVCASMTCSLYWCLVLLLIDLFTPPPSQLNFIPTKVRVCRFTIIASHLSWSRTTH